MILNKNGHPTKNLDRARRLEWLIQRIDKYKLKTYPWGLSRLTEDNKVRRERELIIIKAMRLDGLFSDNTTDIDININNLIIDAVSYSRNGRYVP